MPSDDERAALLDMRDNIRMARLFVGEMSYAQFAADRRTFYAVSRCLEIISEASRRVPEAVRQRHAHLPWRAIADLGNVYRHEYQNVAEARTWRTLSGSLDELDAMIALELALNDPDSGPALA